MKYFQKPLIFLLYMLTKDSRKVKVETNYNGGWELAEIFNIFEFDDVCGSGFTIKN